MADQFFLFYKKMDKTERLSPRFVDKFGDQHLYDALSPIDCQYEQELRNNNLCLFFYNLDRSSRNNPDGHPFAGSGEDKLYDLYSLVRNYNITSIHVFGDPNQREDAKNITTITRDQLEHMRAKVVIALDHSREMIAEEAENVHYISDNGAMSSDLKLFDKFLLRYDKETMPERAGRFAVLCGSAEDTLDQEREGDVELIVHES